MEEHDIHSIAVKQQVVREYFAGVKLFSLARRHGVSLTVIRTWVDEYFHGLDGNHVSSDGDGASEAASAARERHPATSKRRDDT